MSHPAMFYPFCLKPALLEVGRTVSYRAVSVLRIKVDSELCLGERR